MDRRHLVQPPEAGVHGAQPGIILNADRQVFDSFRQEYYAPGVGLVSERALSGDKEVVELLSITPP